MPLSPTIIDLDIHDPGSELREFTFLAAREYRQTIPRTLVTLLSTAMHEISLGAIISLRARISSVFSSKKGNKMEKNRGDDRRGS
jgi:hypothetical protein